MMRESVFDSARCAVVLAALAAAPSAMGQLLADFESPAYTGSTTGDAVTGQNGWYIPAVGGTDGRVFTYDGNSLGSAADDCGACQGMLNTISGGLFARAQHDVDFSSADVWRVRYHFLGDWLIDPPAINNLASFSFQDSASQLGLIALASWSVDQSTTATHFQLFYLGEDGGGFAHPQPGYDPGAMWEAIPVGVWHEVEHIVNFATGQVLVMKLTNLETGECASHFPTDVFLGGRGVGLARPTAVRCFTGSAIDGGNLAGWDNITVEPIDCAELDCSDQTCSAPDCADPCGGGCPADYDGDGFLTGLDFDLFVQDFEAGEPASDYDGDGFITGLDFDLFVQDFEAGCE